MQPFHLFLTSSVLSLLVTTYRNTGYDCSPVKEQSMDYLPMSLSMAESVSNICAWTVTDLCIVHQTRSFPSLDGMAPQARSPSLTLGLFAIHCPANPGRNVGNLAAGLQTARKARASSWRILSRHAARGGLCGAYFYGPCICRLDQWFFVIESIFFILGGKVFCYCSFQSRLHHGLGHGSVHHFDHNS